MEKMMQTKNKITPANGQLKVHPSNPRYFTDGTGRIIYLTGSHTWSNFKDMGKSEPPPPIGLSAWYFDGHQTPPKRISWRRGNAEICRIHQNLPGNGEYEVPLRPSVRFAGLRLHSLRAVADERRRCENAQGRAATSRKI